MIPLTLKLQQPSSFQHFNSLAYDSAEAIKQCGINEHLNFTIMWLQFAHYSSQASDL